MSQSTIQPSSTSSNVDASGESEFEISNLRSTASHLPRGAGEVEFARVAGKTVALRAQSCNPLKLLMPRSSGGCGWLFTSTYGGGLVEGDDIRLGVIARATTDTSDDTTQRDGGPNRIAGCTHNDGPRPMKPRPSSER